VRATRCIACAGPLRHSAPRSWPRQPVRLETALVSDGPVDADLRERFFASAEAALAVLAEMETPSWDASAQGTEPGCKEHSPRVREL